MPPEDEAALVAGLESMLYDEGAREAAKAAVAEVAEEYRWSRVLAPLVEFCRAPQRAADIALRSSRASQLVGPIPLPSRGLRADLDLMRDYFRIGGVREVVTRASGRIARVVTRGGRT